MLLEAKAPNIGFLGVKSVIAGDIAVFDSNKIIEEHGEINVILIVDT